MRFITPWSWTARSRYVFQSRTVAGQAKAEALAHADQLAKQLEAEQAKAQQQVEAQIGYKSVSWQEANSDLIGTFAVRDFIMMTVMGAMLMVASFATYRSRGRWECSLQPWPTPNMRPSSAPTA